MTDQQSPSGDGSPPTGSQTSASATEAVALKYERDDLPRVVAKGKGLVAERILALAREYEVPIHQDARLSQALSQLDLNQPIPRELFLAIAQVLVFAYSLKSEKKAAVTAAASRPASTPRSE